MARTLGREVILTRQRKIAELAQREPKLTLTTLAHHVDDVWMREAYRRIRKDAAAGVDGVTAAQYEADLEANLSGLLERFKSGGYRAPAVRRVHLEKPGTNKTRPIGIPTLEDKVLQRAVLMVMEPVYEQDFVDCSYGFRPGRSAHQALDALWQGLMKLGGGWVIDLDIEDFFGSVDWGHMRCFLDRRVRDGVIRRAIGKWLNAGVMEAGKLSHPQRGTPQGGVVSPTLSNVYLHEVLDQWFEHDVKPRLRGRAFEVRYADDAVLVFEHEDDARRVCCFSHSLVGSPRELVGVFRRWISWDDGVLREPAGAGHVAFPMNRCCRSGENVDARAPSVCKGWASAAHLSIALSTRSVESALSLTGGRRSVRRTRPHPQRLVSWGSPS